MSTIVDFGNQNSLLGRLRAGFNAIYNHPGPKIDEPTPFAPGTVSTPAILAKLGETVFAHARGQANFRSAEETARAKEGLVGAQTQAALARAKYYEAGGAQGGRGAIPRYTVHVPGKPDPTFTGPIDTAHPAPEIGGQDITGVTPDAALAFDRQQRAAAAGGTNSSMVTVSKPMFGYKGGETVPKPEFQAQARASIARELAGLRHDRGGYPAAASALRAMGARLGVRSPESLQFTAEALDSTNSLRKDLFSTDAQARSSAAQTLGLPHSFKARTPGDMSAADSKSLDYAANLFSQRLYAHSMADFGKSLQPGMEDMLGRISREAPGAAAPGTAGNAGLDSEVEDWLNQP